MLQQFLKYIGEKELFEKHQKVLLAVSGGIDSMVLWHLFEKSGLNYGIVHCNFRLRGNESDEDEKLVREQATERDIQFFYKSFETEEYAALNGISIEMAARELRYEFFEKVRFENDYDFIATAHHQDDLIETFFLNLVRKTGIKGLTGIKEKSGNIIRPLLFADREEVEKYANEKDVFYREDSSNSEVIFQRNFLRHKILPLFSELNPAFRKNLVSTVWNLREAEKVYDAFLSGDNEKVIVQESEGLSFNIEALKKTAFPLLVLLEVLKDFGFNPAVIEEIYNGLDSVSGKQFFSRTHRVVKDRDKLFVLPIPAKDERIYYIEKDDIELFEPYDLVIGKYDNTNFEITKKPTVASLDFDELEFPLLIRKWRQGDYFQPLGMSGLKKLSDFFIDEKIPVHEKEKVWLLCSGQKIVWVMGYRIDNRFKVSPETQRILKIEIKQNNA